MPPKPVARALGGRRGRGDSRSMVVRGGVDASPPARPRGPRRGRRPRARRGYWYRFRAGDVGEPGRPHPHAAGRRRRRRSRCASPSPPASTGSRATSPPTSTWPRKTSTSSSTSATTSTSTRRSDNPVRASTPGREIDHARRLPQPLRAVPDRPGPAGDARRVPVDRHLGRPRGRQQLRRRPLAGRRPAPSRSCAAAPPPTRPTTSTCRCAPVRLPRGPDMQLYRPLPFGRLADFSVLDTRQYRTPSRAATARPRCATAARAAGATILGERAARLAVRSPRPLAGALERAGPAGDDGAGRHRRRAAGGVLDGPVAGYQPDQQAPARASSPRASRRTRSC